MIKEIVSSWGRLHADVHSVFYPHKIADVPTILNNKSTSFLAFGKGRSYGDVCLNPEGALINTTALDRFIHFDSQTGVLKCEAGVLLKDIQAFFIPQGWMLPVTPGTQFVTVGGAIANDVHGKSHHVCGTFGAHVLAFDLLRSNGETLHCTPTSNSPYFAATIGGLGLTGIITTATLQLQKTPGAWLKTENIAFKSLDEFFELSQSSTEWAHTVAWIDCLNTQGRGIFMRGNFVAHDEVPRKNLTLAMPFTPPFSMVNALSLRAFNMAYYTLMQAKKGECLTHYVPFFYPLDNVRQWNRLYGPKGFYQYQSVVPPASAKEATAAMLQSIAQSGTGSFLAVLKTFGNQPSPGLLSFPFEGTTLALDFPNLNDKTENLFTNLDAIVQNAGGRLYPAKDARMPRTMFHQTYPQLNEFLKWRDKGFSSDLFRRLME